MGAPRGLGRPNCSPFLLPAEPPLPGQTVAKLFDTLFVVLDALLVAYCRSFFSMMFFISSRSLLGSILSSQTDAPTFEDDDFILGIITFLKNRRFRPKDGFESVWALSRVPFGSSWGYLGSSLGLLDRPNRAS